MDLSALSFFQNLRQDNQKFAVIGLSRFGRAVCSTLHCLGYEVLATDIDEKRVSEALAGQIVNHALKLDSTEASALKEAGIFEFDIVIVAIGDYVLESIITTLNVKEASVPYVVAQASSEIHQKLLKRVGADYVVFPDYEASLALAFTLTQPSIIDRFEFDQEDSIVELIVPNKFHGKTIAELQLRNLYGLNVIAVGKNGKFRFNPNPAHCLECGSTMLVIASNKNKIYALTEN